MTNDDNVVAPMRSLNYPLHVIIEGDYWVLTGQVYRNGPMPVLVQLGN